MAQPAALMDAASLVSLGVLGVLVLRRLVITDRLHALRVAVITALLWGGAFYLFTRACSNMFYSSCDFISFNSDVYPYTEP